ncbi:MAG: hypothetical protein ACE3L7_06765 [Candidatus Pristimantibacillus sp.]
MIAPLLMVIIAIVCLFLWEAKGNTSPKE